MADPSISFMIAAPSQVYREIKKNKNWIYGALLLILIWIFVSTFLFSLLESEKYFNSIYFTVINVTTVGFGDIVPKTIGGRILTMVNSLVGVIAFGCFVAIITAALQPSSFEGTATLQPDGGSIPTKPQRSDRETPSDVVADAVGDFFRGLGAIIRVRNPEFTEQLNVSGSSVGVLVRTSVPEAPDGIVWVEITIRST